MVFCSVRTPCMQSILVRGPLSPDLHMAEELNLVPPTDAGDNIRSRSRSVISYKNFMRSTLLSPSASLRIPVLSLQPSQSFFLCFECESLDHFESFSPFHTATMPSITSLLSYAAIALLTSSQLCSASPMPMCKVLVRTTPSLPTTGSGTQLPAPAAGLGLKFVTLGRGVQNYTCSGSYGTPTAIGAVADIFEITAFAQSSPTSPSFTGLPAAAVYLTIPGVQQLLNTRMPAGNPATIIGKHFFNSAGVPTFDLSARGKKLLSKVLDKVPAPATADKGPAGTGAVPWLKLDDAGGSNGLKEVYRVYTAGGNAPTSCSSAGVISVEYAAMYWFYG